MGRDIKNAIVFAGHGIGSVAMMDIKINDRDFLQAVLFLRVQGTDKHRVKQAKTHGAGRFRVMAGRAHGAEGGFGFSVHYIIHRGDGRTGSVQSGAVRTGGHPCVPSIQRYDSGHWLIFFEGEYVVFIMRGEDMFERCGSRFFLRYVREISREKIQQRLQAFGAFNMPFRGDVIEAGRVGIDGYGHGLLLSQCATTDHDVF